MNNDFAALAHALPALQPAQYRVFAGPQPDAGEACAASTLDTFCALLGGFAGNIALTFDARGGLFIGGGIVAELGEAFLLSPFRERFESKGRFAPWLRKVATPLIIAPQATLLGAAAALGESFEGHSTP